MIEEFRKITGFEDYEISNLGTVRNKHGRILNSHPTSKIGDGNRIGLYKTPEQRYKLLIKRLIAENFIGSVKDKEVVIIDVFKPLSPDNLVILECGQEKPIKSRMKIEIVLEDWSHDCGDGCCTTFGEDIYLNGKKLDEQQAEDSSKALTVVLEELGYNVTITRK